MGQPAWVLGPSIGRADGPGLCAQLADRLRGPAPDTTAPYLVDISTVINPDVGTVDTLARLQLTARRFGRRLSFRAGAHEPRLRELIGLAGLDRVLPLEP